jgi:hypothetical protein
MERCSGGKTGGGSGKKMAAVEQRHLLANKGWPAKTTGHITTEPQPGQGLAEDSPEGYQIRRKLDRQITPQANFSV